MLAWKNTYVETKHCGRCSRDLPQTSFSKHRGRPDGLQAYCKECTRAANKKSLSRNATREVVPIPEQKRCSGCRVVLPANAFYRDKRRPDGLYANCKICHRKVTDQWAVKNEAARLATRRAWYARNATSQRARSRAWRDANRDRALENLYRWKAENRARLTALETVRRARKAGAAGSATPDQVAARIAYYGGKCWMCGAPYQEIDHVKPVARGGPNWPSNLRPACKPCNSSKNARWPLTA